MELRKYLRVLIAPNLHGWALGHRAQEIRGMIALFVSPDDVVFICEDASSDGGSIVSTKANHH